MARKKQSTRKGNGTKGKSKPSRQPEAQAPEVEAQADDENGSPGVGHNGPAELTEDQRISLTFTHKRAYVAALAAKKKADADLKNVCKLAKAELGPDAVPDIKDMILLETEDGEAKLVAEVERKARVARWMGLPIGAQGALFLTPDPTPAVDRARANGKRDGLAGEPCQPNCDPSVPQYRAYMESWHEGQAVLVGTMAANPTPLEVAASDEFDDLPPSEDASETHANA